MAEQGGRPPAVTIGVPVRNGERYIARALESLLSQTFADFEVVIADNASTDRTFAICAECARDPRIRLARNPHNVGAAGNFSIVLQRARGRYFMWAAADDRWTPDFLASLVPELELHPEADIAWCATKRIWEDGRVEDIVGYPGSADPSRMGHGRLALATASGNHLHLSIYGLYRTGFLRRAFEGFPPVIYGDLLFTCQVALATRFRYVDRPMFIRQIAARPIHERHVEDPDAGTWKDPLGPFASALAAGPYLLRSTLIPRRRKLWAIPIVWQLLFQRGIYGGIWNLAYVVRQRLPGRRR